MSNAKCSILKFENIYFSYIHDEFKEKKYVLEDVSFDIKVGDYVCVVGHNGSGKSTISKLISCLVRPDSGNYYINNQLVDKKNVDTLRRKIGVIFQNPDNQFIGLTTEDDIAFGLENYYVKQEDMKAIIENSAKIINISDLLTKEPFRMSGGQKQKVAITSVLALFPEVIIFDESTSMLDPIAKLELKQLMKFLQTKYNRTIVSITHDMEELKQASKILCMQDGKVAKFCDLDELIKDYEFLKKSKLDLPFTLKLSKLLNDKGMKINLTLDQQKLVEEICRRK